LPLVAVIAGLVFWWGIRGQALLGEVKDAVAEELTRAFGTKVSVGSAELTAWNVVTLKNSRVFDRQGRIFAAIPEAIVEVDPLRLLWTRNVVESIGRVRIEGPEVSLYREPDGKWNIDELLTQDLPESRAFKGKLTLAGGQVHLHEENRTWEISPIAGSLDFAENPAVKFRLNLRGQDQRARTFGTFTPQGYGVLTLQGQNQDLEAWQGLFPGDWPLADLKGKIRQLDITLNKDREGLKFAGEIRSDGISGRFADIQWTEVAGLITFSDKEVQFYDVSGKINEQLVSVTGKVLQPMREPELAVRVKTENFDPAAVAPEIPVAGRFAVDAEITGTWQSLQASGRLAVGAAAIQGWSLTGFTTRFAGRRAGEDWTARVWDGQGILAGEALGDLQLTLAQTDRQLNLRGLWGRWGNGYLAADGLLGPDRLDLDLTGTALPLAAISRVYPDLQATGALDFSGKLTGTTTAMELGGRFQAIDGMAFHQPFTRALGNISLADGVLTLAKTEIRNGAGLHKIDGWVSLAGSRAINMKVTTERARAEDLVAWLAPDEPLTGNVENEVLLTGSLDSLEAEGRLTLWEGSYQGFLLTKVSGNYRRNAGILTLDDFEVDSFNAKATIAGTVDNKQRLDLSVNANELEIAYIQLRYPYQVEGKVSLNGHLAGTLTKPEFTGEIMSRTIKLNGQDLFDIGGNIVLRRDEIQVSAVHFLLGRGQVRANGGYRQTDSEVYGGLSVENTEISSLLSILNTPLPGVSGRLNGQIALTGTTDLPALQVFGTMHGGRIKGYPLDSIELDVSLRNRLITVNQLRASQGSGFIAAKGTADLKGPLAMEVGGKDIDAGILAAWLDTKTEIKGKLDFLAQIGGTADSPQAGVSLAIRDGGVTNATFDELFGLFVLKDGIIQINQLYVNKGEHRASVYGTLPLRALDRQRLTQATAADSMDLKFRLDQANLSILPLLSPEVQWATGATQGEVHVGGTLVRPIFTGRISVADGSLKLKSLADPLEKLGVDIQFEDDKMNVTRIAGAMGGGTIQLKGMLSINGEQGIGSYTAELLLDKLMIRHKVFKGPLNGNITLTRKNSQPTLGGTLRFEDSTLNILGIPDSPATDLDFAMDMEVVIGKNVRAYSPSLYDIWLGGGLHFGGTLQKPQITGKINLVRGSLEYIGTRFRLAEGSVDFPSRRSLDPQIHLEAYANLSRTKVMLNIDGPASQMELKLSSIPALSPQEIRTVLALRPRSGETLPPGAMNSDELAREEMRALLTSGLRMQVFGDFENTFREAFGLDDFRLVSGARTSSREPVTFGSSVASGKPASLQEVYTLEFSKYIGDRVEVTYSMGVNRSEYLATIRYDLSSEFSFNASIDERNSPRVGVEYRLRF
jgi:translocation and assembly module TamB